MSRISLRKITWGKTPRETVDTDRSSLKKLGKWKTGTYGRTHGPTRGNSKRRANKAVRKEAGVVELRIGTYEPQYNGVCYHCPRCDTYPIVQGSYFCSHCGVAIRWKT